MIECTIAAKIMATNKILARAKAQRRRQGHRSMALAARAEGVYTFTQTNNSLNN